MLKPLLAPCFKRGGRRALTALTSAILMGASSLGLVWYLDERCTEPSLGFALILAWLCLLAALAWVLVMALSPTLIVPSVLATWAKGGWGETPVELELPELDELDPRHYQVNPQGRFKLLYTLAIAIPTLGVHVGYDQFLTRFQREGTARIAIRNSARETRLWGLEQLSTQALSGQLSQSSSQLNEALRELLKDPEPSVRVKVTAVLGALNVTSAAPDLSALALDEDAPRELKAASLLAFAQFKTSALEDNPARDALKHLSASPQLRAEVPYELSIALGFQRINAPESVAALRAVYSLTSGVGGDVKAREAAVWALGELRDVDLLPTLSEGLSDEALSVRCLAAYGLEKLAAFESSAPLRAAWGAAKKGERCPRVSTPKGAGFSVVMMPDWGYQLVLVRALASTDDPLLLTWLVEHQHDVEPLTHRLMKKYYDALTERDQQGLLEEFKRRNARTSERKTAQDTRQSTQPQAQPQESTP